MCTFTVIRSLCLVFLTVVLNRENVSCWFVPPDYLHLTADLIAAALRIPRQHLEDVTDGRHSGTSEEFKDTEHMLLHISTSPNKKIHKLRYCSTGHGLRKIFSLSKHLCFSITYYLHFKEFKLRYEWKALHNHFIIFFLLKL